MLKVLHWVITRFNYGLYKQRSKAEADEWMRNRMKLFIQYTVRSMRNQTDKDFVWLILLDSDTPLFYAHLIEEHTQGLNRVLSLVDSKNFIGKKYGERMSINNDLSEAIRTAIVGQSKKSIQTRLDNDDFYAPDTIKLIKQYFLGQCASSVVEFKYGYIYDKVKNQLYEAFHEMGSPWISLFTDNSTGETVYDKIHVRYKKLSYQILEYRSWMMVVHEWNITNRVFEHMMPLKVNTAKIFKELGLQ